MQFARTSTSPAETGLIGAALGRLMMEAGTPGDIILIDGPLGAGKTTFTRAVAEGMGLSPAEVSSPTFIMVHDYARAQDYPPGPALIHIDAYRLHSENDLDALGFDRLIARVDAGEAALLVEWAERLGPDFPGDRPCAHIRIEHLAENQREFFFRIPDAWSARPGFAALTARKPTRCPITDETVPPDSPTYPFASERARLADLYRWFSGSYQISRPIEERDLEEGID